ncbi:BQ5605_C032g11104 [Microbotryum silenes-dioicae]|uniref:Dolichyl-diphosphooligosaccharide--protein glycosyltransferase subunit WBP1 n=1 Tax=Microbotryum silenes-dioicae TaxID=796604 RepID=A0A2X0N3H0_9BASI|nr:BQ5605_C032g11104 [Microbotryum silenes-dioicae]
MFSKLGRYVAVLCLYHIAAQIGSVSADKVLVVLEKDLEQQDYALTWSSLEARGHELCFRDASERATSTLEASQFQHILLFAPSAKQLPEDLNPQRLVEYTQHGKNLLVALSPHVSEFWRDFAREFDLEFDDRGTRVIDHFSYDVSLDDDSSHSVIVVPLSGCRPPFVASETGAGPPVLYRGIGHAVGRRPLATNILYAPVTSYSGDPSRVGNLVDDVHLAGTSTGLVTAFQAKNNARITFVGSTDVFSDVFQSASIESSNGLRQVDLALPNRYPRSGNTAFLSDLTRWTMQETGIIRIDATRHYRASDGQRQDLYRMGEELAYDVDLVVKDKDTDLSAHLDDLQLEFTMLDPHLRVPLTISGQSIHGRKGETAVRYTTSFHAPDRHGVFALRVDYRRPGWSFLDEKAVVSVAPSRHDEFERFITGALPYYGGALSVSVATLVLVILWTLQ